METGRLLFYSNNIPNQSNSIVNITNSTTTSNQYSRPPPPPPPPSSNQSNHNQPQSSNVSMNVQKGGAQSIKDYLNKVTEISKNHDVDSIYRPALTLCLEQADATSTLSPEAKQFSDKSFNEYWEWCNENELKALPVTEFIAALYLGSLPHNERRNGFLALEAYRHKCSQIFLNASIIHLSGIVWTLEDMNIWSYYVKNSQINLGLCDVIQDLLAVKGALFQRPPGSHKLKIPYPPYTHGLSPKASTSYLAPPLQTQASPRLHTTEQYLPKPQNYAHRQLPTQPAPIQQSQATTSRQPNISAPIISSTMSRNSISNSNTARQNKGKGREDASSDAARESLILNPLPDVRSLLNQIQAKEKYDLRKAALEITSKESVWNSHRPEERYEECEFMRSIWNVEDILEQLDFVERLEKEWLGGRKEKQLAVAERFDPDVERDDNNLIMQSIRSLAVSQQARTFDTVATLSQEAFLAGSTKSKPYDDYTPQSHFEGWTDNIVRQHSDLPIPLAFDLQSALTPFPVSFVPSFFPRPPTYQPRIRNSATKNPPSIQDFSIASKSQQPSRDLAPPLPKLYPPALPPVLPPVLSPVLPPVLSPVLPPALPPVLPPVLPLVPLLQAPTTASSSKTIELKSTSALAKPEEASTSAAKIPPSITQPLPLLSPSMPADFPVMKEAELAKPIEMVKKSVEVIEKSVEVETPVQKAVQIVENSVEVIKKATEVVSDKVAKGLETTEKSAVKVIEKPLEQDDSKLVEKSTEVIEVEVVKPARTKQITPALRKVRPSVAVLPSATPPQAVVRKNVSSKVNGHKALKKALKKDTSFSKEIAIVVIETTVKKAGTSSKTVASTSTPSVKSSKSKGKGKVVSPTLTEDLGAAPLQDAPSIVPIDIEKLASLPAPLKLATAPIVMKVKKKDKKRKRSASIDLSDQKIITSPVNLDENESSKVVVAIVESKEERKARRKAKKKEKKRIKAMLNDVTAIPPPLSMPLSSSSDGSDQEVARRLAPTFTPTPSPLKILPLKKSLKSQAHSELVASTSATPTTPAITPSKTPIELKGNTKKRRRSPSPSSMVKQKWQHKTSSSTPFRPFG